MPTVHRFDPYRCFFWSEENQATGEPPHIHVRSANGLALCWLSPVEYRNSWGYTPREIERVRRLVIAHRGELLRPGMTISTTGDTLSHPRAIGVEIDANVLRVTVADGRTISVPVTWFNWLAGAADRDRREYRLLGGGAGIWWDRLDEGISVPSLFGLPEDL